VETQGKLLLVDDELSVRDSLGKWFREEGYEIGTAESASDALTRMAENKWDLALLDIKMRGTDGIELQRRLHEMDPDLIVIMMTGYASVETAVTALKNGAYDYVSKPLDPDEIAHLVRRPWPTVELKKRTFSCAPPSPKSRGQANSLDKVPPCAKCSTPSKPSAPPMPTS
jgi:DNA-binding NtrC family response regulator